MNLRNTLLSRRHSLPKARRPGPGLGPEIPCDREDFGGCDRVSIAGRANVAELRLQVPTPLRLGFSCRRSRRSAPLVRLVPVDADADVDSERHGQLRSACHVLAQRCSHHRHLVLGHLQHQLIVHLHDEPRA
jgi:hypothetical protein